MKICKVSKNCNNKYHTNGYCNKHYLQVKRHGRLTPELEKEFNHSDKCKVKDCDNKYYSKGYCHRHYQQYRIYGKIKERTYVDPNKIIVKNDYCEMVLYNIYGNERATTLFSKIHLEKIKKHKWSMDAWGYCASGKPKIKLHHLIKGKPPKGLDTDHINRNKLDNRDKNLRFCTRSENILNSKLRKDNTSGITGVGLIKEKNNWRAEIKVNKKVIRLGHFDKKEDAIKARKNAEKKYELYLL